MTRILDETDVLRFLYCLQRIVDDVKSLMLDPPYIIVDFFFMFDGRQG